VYTEFGEQRNVVAVGVNAHACTASAHRLMICANHVEAYAHF
jgi:hypothetical protein